MVYEAVQKSMAYKNKWAITIQYHVGKSMACESSWSMKLNGLGKSMAYKN